MNRRSFLTTTGLGVCVSFHLPPVKVSWDRIIRTTVALRPHREPPALDIHTMPRSDGIALGGTSQRGLWTLEPDEAERRRIVEEHIELFSKMKVA